MKTMWLLLLWVALPAFAGEGKWTPQQVLELDPAWLKAQGLQLPPGRLWDAQRGTGLLAGAVNVGGCSGAFISSTGLVITNHHCVFSIIQEHSSPQRDLISQGFLAANREAELPGKGARILVPRAFTDVTKQVLAAVPAGADDLARFKAIERQQKELVAACEKRPATRCQLAAFDGGSQYVLVDSVELADVRLVYAPPRAVGEFGGEEDNWMWPRHTGDFAIVRAYSAPDGAAAAYSEKNVPHRAEFFFPLAPQGVQPGDFVMVLGYPGISFRALLAEEMAERQARFYPRVIDFYGEAIRILTEEGAKDAAGKIAVASTLKSLHNRAKNASGQLAGLARGRIIEKQQEHEAAVVRWAQARPEYAGALVGREELRESLKEEALTWEREFLLNNLRAGARGVSMAATLGQLARERAKPDMEREPEFMERELVRLKDQFEREQKNLFVPAEKRLLQAFVRRAQALGPAERIAAVDKHFGRTFSEKAVTAKINALYATTKVLTLSERMAMFQASEAQLQARKDALLAFGLDLATELTALDAVKDRREGARRRLRPEWRRAVLAHAGKPVAPDANGTLRVTFAKVEGYSPRDGVFYTPQTTLSGVLAKHTDAEPFDVPDKVLATARERRFGPWADAALKDVPVDFLSSADTTGGNSGSPTVNGKGELVGVNFDRVWENVANDFGYNPDVARNVNVDVRYVLWMLDQVENADGLLRELGVRKGPSMPGEKR
ncbi:dipeptidyl-peptidase 7. Serine peptidase. MEROPS family S46 [Stigmatella aurantiaca]|uniref:Dipeptidyl-peptidase n=1 Tax=Stigmatella aurantiaca TaxID=41 RepID=A0A1H8BZI5_STIAU|nr:S46 family peptidase [Stigmatella aurantiaca]SEM88206.1 dipeptidyl-peptidase 7. Serine peptidase. MEROPS family S46 [Stigmatella aurantiaca]